MVLRKFSQLLLWMIQHKYFLEEKLFTEMENRLGGFQVGDMVNTIKQSVGYGYIRSSKFIDNQFVLDGEYELEIATKMVPCKVHLKALYDPEMKNIKV